VKSTEEIVKEALAPVILVLCLAVLVGGCTAIPPHEKSHLMLENAGSAINIPLSQLNGAKVLGSSGVLILFADGSSMHVDTLLSSDLDYKYDLRLYPKYLLGLADPRENESLQAAEVSDLLAARDILLPKAGEAKEVVMFKTNRGHGYAAIGEEESVLFLINPENTAAITQVHTESMARSTMQKIIEGTK
jgi:hypothetical protein